jgi:hypothetical protein
VDITDLEQGTSVNSLVREYIARLAGESEAAEGLAEFLRIVSGAGADSGSRGRSWGRDELHAGPAASRTFVDTNVVAYAADESPAEKAKHDAAVELLTYDPEILVLSTQALQEFYHVVTRRLEKPLDPSGQPPRRVRSRDWMSSAPTPSCRLADLG